MYAFLKAKGRLDVEQKVRNYFLSLVSPADWERAQALARGRVTRYTQGP